MKMINVNPVCCCFT